MTKQQKLDSEEEDLFRKGHCPDCLADLREGPSGGLSINFYCTGANCGSRFNDMWAFGIERISEKQPLRSPSPLA